MNIFRRLSLHRLLLVCAIAIVAGVSATALASAVGSSAKPPAKPLAAAVHDALGASPVEGVSANITLTNRLLEGASLASGNGQTGGLASSPLVKGGSGRLWVAKDGRVRLELQAEKGDTEILFDGKTVTMYDAANNTLYRYDIPAGTQKDAATKSDTSTHAHQTPTLSKIEEAITHLKEHVNVSEATPANVAGQPAYTVRVSPKESGSLLGGAELSFDSAHGIPLRAAIYSSTSPSSPVIELAATEISYGPVEASVFSFTPPSGAKVEDLTGSAPHAPAAPAEKAGKSKPTLTGHGHGVSTIGVLESKTSSGAKSTNSALEGLPKVKINGATASELRTELGTILTFERSGVRYVLGGSVTPAAIEALARGL
jgi:outer membrane lipoprotein-sorting protein